MADRGKPDEIAVNRYKIIAPIIAAMEEKADRAKLVLLKKVTCTQFDGQREHTVKWKGQEKIDRKLRAF